MPGLGGIKMSRCSEASSRDQHEASGVSTAAGGSEVLGGDEEGSGDGEGRAAAAYNSSSQEAWLSA